MQLELVRSATEATTPITEDHGMIPDDEARAMAEASVRLFDHWNLKTDQRSKVLGGVSKTTLNRWRQGVIGVISADLATRLSLLMGMHKALRLIFIDKERAYSWITTPNDDLNGIAPIDYMARGDIMSLYQVRAYLDAARGR